MLLYILIKAIFYTQSILYSKFCSVCYNGMIHYRLVKYTMTAAMLVYKSFNKILIPKSMI